MDPVAWHAGDRSWSAPLWPMPSIAHSGAGVEAVDGDPAFDLPAGAMLDWGRFAAEDDRITLHFRVRLTPAADPPEFYETYLASWMGPNHRGILKLRPDGLHWDLEHFAEGAWRPAHGFDCGKAPLHRWSSVVLRAGQNSWDVWIDGKKVAAGADPYSPPPRGAMVRFMGNIGAERVMLAGDATAEGDVAAGARADTVKIHKARGLDVRVDDLILFDRRLTDAEVGALGALDRDRACTLYKRRMEPGRRWTAWACLGVGVFLLLIWQTGSPGRWVALVLLDRSYRAVQGALGLGAVLTAGLVILLHREAMRADAERFKELHGILWQLLDGHIEKIALEIRRVGDWVGSQSRLDPAAWTRWVEASSMLHDHSALLGIGYAQQVPEGGRQAHELDWSGRWGFPYSVWPADRAGRAPGSATRFEGDPRLPVVLYACKEPIEARWRTNGTILGRDLLWVDPAWQRVVPEPRRIEHAVGHHGMTASGRERIAPEEWFDAPVYGLRLYEPCLVQTGPWTKVIRADAWRGVAFANVDLRRWYLNDFRAMNLPMGFRIYTGDGNGDRHDLLLDSGKLVPEAARPGVPRLEHVLEIRLYGSRLWIDCWTTKAFEGQSRAHWPWVAGWAGGGFTLLTALALGFQVRARVRERSYAEQLAEANRALARSQHERECLSRDLHDGSIQSLYAVGLHLRHTRRRWAGGADDVESHLVECQKLVQDAIVELREFLLRLKDDSEPAGTYAEVLEEWLRRLRRVTLMELELTVGEGADRLPSRTVVELVQITREAVSNAIRHAEAQKISIRLARPSAEAADWVLEVCDDGKGFDPGASVGTGLGLRTMRERAEELGGRLEWVRGTGTTLRVCFPAGDGLRNKEA